MALCGQIIVLIFFCNLKDDVMVPPKVQKDVSYKKNRPILMSVSKHCTIYHGMFSQLSSCFLSIRVLLLYFQMKAGRNINSGFNNANNLNYRLRNDDHKIMNKMNTNHNSYCHRITNFSSYSRAPSQADRKRLEVCLELNCPQRFS